MYLITAIINQECVMDILEDLKASEIEGVTISKVAGKGNLLKIVDKEVNCMNEFVRLEIVVSNDYYKELAKEAIRANARNKEVNSGKMWVTPVLEVERMRTGETNEDALSHANIKDTSVNTDTYFDAMDTPAS